jgi:hypothetical protein
MHCSVLAARETRSKADQALLMQSLAGSWRAGNLEYVLEIHSKPNAFPSCTKAALSGRW